MALQSEAAGVKKVTQAGTLRSEVWRSTDYLSNLLQKCDARALLGRSNPAGLGVCGYSGSSVDTM